MSKIIDLKGKVFGRLTVISKAPSTGGQAEWWCVCSCGGITKVKGQHLRAGAILSCGCWNKERTSQTSTVDLTGQRFGKLTVIGRVGSKRGRANWRCKCECGNECTVISSYLRTGDTQSCGCVMSRMEEYIAKLLNENNINYERQYSFPDLRGKMHPLRFDFAIFNCRQQLLCLIEYQGQEHYYNTFNLPAEKHQEFLARDEQKRQYCKTHNIKLYELNKDDNLEEFIHNLSLQINDSERIS